MTAHELDRLDELFEDSNQLKKRLNEIRSASTVSAVDASQSGGGGISDPVGRLALQVVDIEDAIIKDVLAMVEIIDTIQSEKTRKIFRRRYIDCRTWKEIADELNYLDPKAPHQRMKRYKRRVKNEGF